MWNFQYSGKEFPLSIAFLWKKRGPPQRGALSLPNWTMLGMDRLGLEQQSLEEKEAKNGWYQLLNCGPHICGDLPVGLTSGMAVKLFISGVFTGIIKITLFCLTFANFIVFIAIVL